MGTYNVGVDLVMLCSIVIIDVKKKSSILSRYYDGSSPADEKGWESELLRLGEGALSQAEAGEGHEEVAMSGDKYVVWCAGTDVVAFVSGTDEHDELTLLEVTRS